MLTNAQIWSMLALAHADMLENIDKKKNQIVNEAFKLSINEQRKNMNAAVLAQMMEPGDLTALDKAIAKLESESCTTC